MKENKNQLFFLLLIGIIGFMLLCATGCGGNSCESLQYGSYEEENGTYYGVSIPGCGGCLSSGSGCGGCLWSQSCKFVYGDLEYGDSDDAQTLIAVDTQYYAGGCFGCGQSQESCYSGCLIQDSQNWGLIYGSTDSNNEQIIGCADGSGGCHKSGGIGQILITIIEYYTGIG